MKGYRTKRIALPGGRMIEIVYFYETPAEPVDAPATDEPSAEVAAVATAQADPASPPLPAQEPSRAAPALHVCPECDGRLVYPVAWEERSDDRWRIERRCPSCEWIDAGEFDQAEVEDFDDVLNDGTETLLTVLRSFTRANMEEDVERLIDALASGLIEPMDF